MSQPEKTNQNETVSDSPSPKRFTWAKAWTNLLSMPKRIFYVLKNNPKKAGGALIAGLLFGGPMGLGIAAGIVFCAATAKAAHDASKGKPIDPNKSNKQAPKTTPAPQPSHGVGQQSDQLQELRELRENNKQMMQYLMTMFDKQQKMDQQLAGISSEQTAKKEIQRQTSAMEQNIQKQASAKRGSLPPPPSTPAVPSNQNKGVKTGI